MSLSMDERGVIVTCEACGRKNRLPFEAREARCGGCKAVLAPPGAPVDVSATAAFDALVARSPLPIVVDFWAPWCGPCRMVAPELEKVAAASAGRYVVVKVNTDVLDDLGARYRIMSIPTMAVFEGGAEIARTSGARPAADIEAFVRDAVARRHAGAGRA